MTSEMRGHEFATQQEMRTAYDATLEVAEQYAFPYDATAIAVGFTIEGLRRLALGQAEALGVDTGLSLYKYDTGKVEYEWLHPDKAEFLCQSITLGPAQDNSQELAQHRTRIASPLFRGAPDKALRDTILGQHLEGQLGTDKLLSYEVYALHSIMKAISTASPEQVRAMMRHPDEITG